MNKRITFAIFVLFMLVIPMTFSEVSDGTINEIKDARDTQIKAAIQMVKTQADYDSVLNVINDLEKEAYTKYKAALDSQVKDSQVKTQPTREFEEKPTKIKWWMIMGLVVVSLIGGRWAKDHVYHRWFRGVPKYHHIDIVKDLFEQIIKKIKIISETIQPGGLTQEQKARWSNIFPARPEWVLDRQRLGLFLRERDNIYPPLSAGSALRLENEILKLSRLMSYGYQILSGRKHITNYFFSKYSRAKKLLKSAKETEGVSPVIHTNGEVSFSVQLPKGLDGRGDSVLHIKDETMSDFREVVMRGNKYSEKFNKNFKRMLIDINRDSFDFDRIVSICYSHPQIDFIAKYEDNIFDPKVRSDWDHLNLEKGKDIVLYAKTETKLDVKRPLLELSKELGKKALISRKSIKYQYYFEYPDIRTGRPDGSIHYDEGNKVREMLDYHGTKIPVSTFRIG